MNKFLNNVLIKRSVLLINSSIKSEYSKPPKLYPVIKSLLFFMEKSPCGDKSWGKMKSKKKEGQKHFSSNVEWRLKSA